MIDKIEFTAKNLTSNAGVLLLLNYTAEQRIFQELDEMLVFDKRSTEEIKMNHLKSLICSCQGIKTRSRQKTTQPFRM